MKPDDPPRQDHRHDVENLVGKGPAQRTEQELKHIRRHRNGEGEPYSISRQNRCLNMTERSTPITLTKRVRDGAALDQLARGRPVLLEMWRDFAGSGGELTPDALERPAIVRRNPPYRAPFSGGSSSP